MSIVSGLGPQDDNKTAIIKNTGNIRLNILLLFFDLTFLDTTQAPYEYFLNNALLALS